MGSSQVHSRLSEKESRSGETLDEILDALGFDLAQAIEFSLERDHSRSSEQIFA